jgi:hypothetical protein
MIDVTKTADAIRTNQQYGNDKVWCVRQGCGMGAIIPLQQYLPPDQPGDYWFMATLPPQNEGEPPWVATPIKVHIEAKSEKPKK